MPAAPITLLVIVKVPGDTAAEAPLKTMARAHWLIALLLITRLLMVVVAGAVFEVTEVIAVGASVAVRPPLPPQ